jgi:hydrogenase maturation protease
VKVTGRSERSSILVLGVGNILYRDEGVGVAAAAELATRDLPGVEVLDGGTLGLSLWGEVEGRESLLLLDAVAGRDEPPGSVIVLGPEAIQKELRLCLSAHHLGVSEVLATASLAGRAPERVAAIAMVPSCMDLGLGLSPVAEAALGGMVEQAVHVLEDWGVLAHA